MQDELLTQVETLKNILVSRATGGMPDNGEFRTLRMELMANGRIANFLPQFLRSCRDLSEFWGFIKPKFAHYHERRDFIREQFVPVLDMLEAGPRAPSDAGVTAAVGAVSSEYVREAWRKALERRTEDPEGAITAARALLESVCKHVLDESGEPYDDHADLPKLYGLASRQLNLSPSQHTEQLFKQILGSCQSVVEGLGALRNRLSDAHGKGKSGVRPASRHAELAVNLAGTMATFLLQTMASRKPS